MTTRIVIVLMTTAVCLLALWWLIARGNWNEAGLLAIAVAGFVLDRASVWEQNEAVKQSPEDEENDNG